MRSGGWKRIKCEVADCERERECKGLCRLHYTRHFVAYRRACLKNGSLTEATNDVLPTPKWEWIGDEQSLIDLIDATELAELAAKKVERDEARQK